MGGTANSRARPPAPRFAAVSSRVCVGTSTRADRGVCRRGVAWLGGGGIRARDPGSHQGRLPLQVCRLRRMAAGGLWRRREPDRDRSGERGHGRGGARAGGGGAAHRRTPAARAPPVARRHALRRMPDPVRRPRRRAGEASAAPRDRAGTPGPHRDRFGRRAAPRQRYPLRRGRGPDPVRPRARGGGPERAAARLAAPRRGAPSEGEDAIRPPFLRIRSVRQKLFAGVLLTSFAALLVTGIALFIYDVRTYRESIARDLEVQAELIGRATSAALQFDDVKFAADNLALLSARPSIRAAALYNARGAIFAMYLPAGAERKDLPPLPGADSMVFSGAMITVFHRIVENGEIVGTVYLSAVYDLRGRALSYSAIVLAVMLASLIVALIFTYWLQAGISQPIIQIAALPRRGVDRRD